MPSSNETASEPGLTAGLRASVRAAVTEADTAEAMGSGDVHLGDHARAFDQDRDLHLHRLQDDQGVAVVDVVAFGRDHLPHVRDHLRADLSHGDSRLLAHASCLPGTYRSPR